MGAASVEAGAGEAVETGSCRVCWEKDETNNLISPCKCAGTQKHVHMKCLRRWQENVQRRDPADERAFRCSVCRTLFTVPPPQKRGTTALWLQLLRGVGGALCISLLAFGLSGPPWPHLALLVLLLLGSRSHWLPGVLLLLAGTTLATMYTRGLRVVVKLEDGGRLGLALIRHGAPVQGIGPGVLLVASGGLDHSIFRRSVVLLTHHGRSGARGVILNQPMPHAPTLPASLTAGTDGNQTTRGGRSSPSRVGSSGGGGGHEAAGAALKHFLGGPVGMPGEGVHHEVVILHMLVGVPGATRLLPAVPRESANAGSAAEVAPRDGDARGRGSGSAGTAAPKPAALYEGGSLSEVLERAADAAAATAAAAAKPRASKRGDRRAGAEQVLLFHGVCGWAEGQLEGELRAGTWSFLPSQAAADVQHLLSLPPDQLWPMLANAPGLVAAAR